jgi:hypothetical protein
MTDTKPKTPSRQVPRSNTRSKEGTKTSLNIDLLQGRLLTVLNEVQSYGDIKGAIELTNNYFGGMQPEPRG